MFTGFQQRALNRNKPRQVAQTQPRMNAAPQRRKRHPLITALCIVVPVIVIGAILICCFSQPHPAHKADKQFNQETTSFIPWMSGVHLNASGQIDKLYDYRDIQKLSKTERASDNVVFFPSNDIGPNDFSIEATSNVTVDGVSYSVNLPIDAYLGSPDALKDTYNAFVMQNPDLSLLGKQKSLTSPSLGRYVDDMIAQRLNNALKSGQIAAPELVYNGTGTEYRNDDIAKAYVAGANPNGLVPECNQNQGNCVQGQMKYDFGCKTVGAIFSDWSAFTDRAIKAVSVPTLNLIVQPGNTYTVNTTVPCRIISDYSVPQPPHQNNVPSPGSYPGENW